MTIGQSIQTCFKKFIIFEGRASRSEYWWWSTFAIVCVFSVLTIDFYMNWLQTDNTDYFGNTSAFGIATSTTILFLLIPSISVSVRRCHDSNHSGWWILCPIVNIIFMFYNSTPSRNNYGCIEKNLNNHKLSIVFSISFVLMCFISAYSVIYNTGMLHNYWEKHIYEDPKSISKYTGYTMPPFNTYSYITALNADGGIEVYFYDMRLVEPLSNLEISKLDSLTKNKTFTFNHSKWEYIDDKQVYIFESYPFVFSNTPYNYLVLHVNLNDNTIKIRIHRRGTLDSIWKKFYHDIILGENNRNQIWKNKLIQMVHYYGY